MTDRAKGCTVAFKTDIRVNDVEAIVDAIKMIKGVEAVELSISSTDDWMNRVQIKSEIKGRFWELYKSI